MTDQQPREDVAPAQQFAAEEVDLDPRVDPSIQEKALDRESKYATLGLVVGAAIALVGAVLIVLGFSGTVDITFQAGESEGSVETGSLGIVVVLIGAAIVAVTRFRFRIRER